MSESAEAPAEGMEAEEARRKQEAAEEYKSQQRAKMLFMGLAYAATIGGVAMLTGTPTNLILLEALRKCAPASTSPHSRLHTLVSALVRVHSYSPTTLFCTRTMFVGSRSLLTTRVELSSPAYCTTVLYTVYST